MRRDTASRIALACGLAIVLVLPLSAEPTKIKVDGAVIKGYITYLASDASLGRRTMTPGYEKAVDWAASKFKEWGLKPAGENGTYFQKGPDVLRSRQRVHRRHSVEGGSPGERGGCVRRLRHLGSGQGAG
jgi:hypothetical protein